MSSEPCTSPVATRSHHALCVGLMLAAVRTPTRPLVSPPASAVQSEPRPVVVPPALRARVPRIELSGLAWAAPLERYLVVVDDSVDLDSENRRGPFVLALDASGRMDSEIVPIDGIDSLDDAEGIAVGADGNYFLLTSHAPTHHGKLRKARRQLLRLQLDGRRLRATGSIDLVRGDNGIPHLLQGLGLPQETAVDLEGLTFHEGALYVGMKAPLLADGSAMILRLSRPAEAFATGRLTPESLSVWGTAKLSVPANGDGALVFQGIADLSFASDGALFLCANSPKGWPNDGGGALWRVDRPAGKVLQPRLAQRFVGLKPEGIAVGPTGRSLTLVFDRNTHEPLWMTWSLAPLSRAGAVPRSQP